MKFDWLKIFFYSLFSFLLVFSAKAQEQWEEGEGDIEDAQVIIEKDREIELPQASRNFERIPPLPVKTVSTELNYNFEVLTPSLTPIQPQVRVLKIKDPTLGKLYGNYVKAGIGNYFTTYLEGYFNNTLNDKFAHEIHVRHLGSLNGPVDKANSGSSESGIDLSAKQFAKNHTFSASLGYQRNRYHFYGYAPDQEINKDDIKQIFNIFEVKGGIEKNKAESIFKYNLQAGFTGLMDHYNARENQTALNLQSSFSLNEVNSIHLISGLYLTTRKDGETAEEIETTKRNLFRLTPYYRLRTEIGNNMLFDFNIGFNFVHENDTAANAGKLHVYPYAIAKYHFTPTLYLYAGVDGDVERTSLLGFINENPYLEPNVPLLHTNKNIDITGGLEGRISNTFGYHAGFSLANYKNMYFYANSRFDSTRFTILYDHGNTFLTNFFGEISVSIQHNFKTLARFDYFHYKTDEIAAPWHKPSTKLSLLSTYNLYDKLMFTADFYLLGGIKGINLASNRERELDAIKDLSFKIDYLFSEKFSAFLHLKNIFATEYERYMNYPSRGFMAIGGLTYSF